MENIDKVDTASIAERLKIPHSSVEAAIGLMDAGNTLSFISRFRRDEVGDLSPVQLRDIRRSVAKSRALAERKTYILKSIESQGELTDELRQRIQTAEQSKHLEDLFLPFKPKKQTHALTARQQGLEPLARDVFEGKSPEVDLATRAMEFVRVDKGLSSVDDVIKGVSHLLAEKYADDVELRKKLRAIISDTAKLTTTRIENSQAEGDSQPESEKPAESSTESSEKTPATEIAENSAATGASDSQAANVDSAETAEAAAQPAEPNPGPASDSQVEPPSPVAILPETASTDSSAQEPADASTALESENRPADPNETTPTQLQAESTGAVETRPQSADSESGSASDSANDLATAQSVTAPSGGGQESANANKKKKKKKKKSKEDTQFKDYFDFSQPLKSVPPHRILAINRGERAKKIRVRFETDSSRIQNLVEQSVEPEHPFREFLLGCVRDSVNRSVLPSLEREIRRELTETSETRALEVFERNLRMLLLQPPIHAKCLIAIDPGYRSGCQLVMLDSYGRLMGTEKIFIVGNEAKLEDSKRRLGQLVERNRVELIAIGNGAGCRAVEKMVSDLISESEDSQLKFVIVNEAGTSVYATSEIGREELPDADPAVRSAISIGRRLLEPLGELVKINAANLGVGLYQHDIKTKHLAQALDEVVEACVNHVGVDVNTASPALLGYVSGLGQLTARRVFEYRQQNGPFKNREQFRQVPGFGEATYVQAAGFLRIFGGENPLDATGIHPESYELARNILSKIQFDLQQLPVRSAMLPTSPLVEMAAADPPAPHRPQPEPAKSGPDFEGIEVAPAAGSGAASAETVEPNQETAAAENPSEQSPPEQPSPAEPGTQTQVAAEPTATSELQLKSEPSQLPDSGPKDADSPPTEETTPAESSAPVPEPTGEPTSAPVETTNVDSAAPAVASTEAAENSAGAPVGQADPRPEPDEQRTEAVRALREKLRSLDIDQLADELNVGKLLLKDVIQNLTRPSRDPRMDLPKPIFRRGILKIDDLKQGMQLKANILNIVDFGVFVDIGLGESSLIHISQLSNRFIRDPHLYFSVGDVLQVWVKEIDESRRRVILTAIRPEDADRPPRKRSARRGQPASSDRGDSSNARRSQSGNQGGQKSGGRSLGRGTNRRGTGSASNRPRRPAKPRAPAKPITDSMIDGKEPMRSFSDLAQLFKIRDDDKGKGKGGKK